jgi:hypothetical protein
MKTQAGYEFQTYEVSGPELRIHWDIQEVEGGWEAQEALCNRYDTRDVLIEKIIGAVYSPSAEIATINNKEDKPEKYAEYQAFRTQAKALADGWIAVKDTQIG